MKNNLAYGYIKDGKLYYQFNFYQMELVKTQSQLGKDLMDFVWIDRSIFEDLFRAIFTRFCACAEKEQDLGKTTDELLNLARPVASKNIYLMAYTTCFILALINDQLDNRFDLDENDFTYEPEDYDKMRASFVGTFADSIANKQETLIDALKQVLYQRKGNLTPLQQLFSLEHISSDSYFDTHFTYSLQSTEDVRGLEGEKLVKAVTKNKSPLIEMAELANINDMFRFELTRMITDQAVFKRCKCCGKFFVPSGRSDSEYCNRIMPGEEKPCKEVGAIKKYLGKAKDNPACKAYMQAYRRMDSRKRNNAINKAEFAKWQYEASTKKEQCENGGITMEEYQVWLDQTKVRK